MTAWGSRAGGRAELLPRVASAIVMAALALGTAWAGGTVFDLFWFAASALVLSEWLRLVGVERANAALVAGCVSLAAAADPFGGDIARVAVVALLAAGASAALAGRGRRLLAVCGLAYAGVLAAAVPMLRRSDPDGLSAILWLFAVVWGTDTMAFFGGRAIGGPKLAPRLSPSKTWSGFGVGVASGAILGLVVAPHSDSPAGILLAGLAAGAIAQGGDLFESSLKRRFGLKDAGSLIPGHGGLMDRLDGFIAAAALAALVGLWRFGPAGAGAGLLKW